MREIEELRAEISRLCEDKFKLQRQLEHTRGDLESKGSQERQLTEQLQSYERQLAEKTLTADQLQKQYDELRAQFDSTQQDKDKKKLVMLFCVSCEMSLLQTSLGCPWGGCPY